MSSMVNEKALYEMLEGDQELLEDMLGSFNEEKDQYLKQMQEGVATSNAELIRTSAHTLKGALQAFCCDEAAETAKTIEHQGSENNLDQIEPLVDRFVQEVNQAHAELTALCERGFSS